MKILVVDDEPALRRTLGLILREDGHDVGFAEHGKAALAKLSEEPYDLVLSDLRMPEMDGLEFIARYRDSGGAALIIAMSAYADAETAIAAMQRGAYDYIQKPFRADEVTLVVRKAAEREKLRAHPRRLEAQAAEPLQLEGGIVAVSAAMQDVLALARKVAPHPSTVLVTGESGTGKELIARAVHRWSPRAESAFVAVNCGAIPEMLLESELFGHAKGSFTGATADKAGLFEEADGGTLLLDEIGELPASLQVKLLRVLQDGEIRRVGANASRRVDVRVLAATNRDLAQEVERGRFRADLFYRINVVTLSIAPLRERTEDIAPLVRHFLVRHAERLGVPAPEISVAALRALEEHLWPGNARELENAVERALVLSGGERVDAGHLPSTVSSRAPVALAPAEDLSVKRQTARLERELIQRALERTRGNRTRAAQLLELSHRALLYKIRNYGLGE